VTPAELIYTGHTIVTTTVTPSNPHYARTHEVLTEANMGICGFGNVVWSAPQGKGIFQLDLVIPVPDTFPEGFDIDLTDSEANKKFFLQDQYFGNFSPDLKEIIQKSEGAWRPWRLYHMPVDSFNWPCQGDVTLIGDAAHATTPWVGDGVNCSMRDALILSRTLAEFGATNEAVAQYEKEMFPWAHDLIKRCVVAGELFLEKDNPRRLVEFFRQNMTDLVGGTDHV
jgi:2-polyprenyl-6-methoxyphenol hydroxylase-like FAD-dependent oxidoreductase